MVRREEGALCANGPELRRLTAGIRLHTAAHFRGCAFCCEGSDVLKKYFRMHRLGEDLESMPHAASIVQLVGSIRLTGDENYEAFGNDLENANRGFYTCDSAHEDVADKDVGSAPGGSENRLFSTVDRFGIVAAQAQDLRQSAGDNAVVIHNEYAKSLWHARSSFGQSGDGACKWRATPARQTRLAAQLRVFNKSVRRESWEFVMALSLQRHFRGDVWTDDDGGH
jgi:hypothetical protein